MLTPEQVANRKLYLGGSDSAAVLGLSRWKTPIRVWAEKVGAVEPDDLSDNFAVEMGNELEDTVARIFTKKTGKVVHRVNEPVKHKRYPFLCAQIDRRVVGENVPLEIKTANAWMAKSWEGEEVPKEYLCQVMHQMAVTDAPYAYIACLIGGSSGFVWKRVDIDESIISEMVSREVDFWESNVLANVMPGPVKAEDSSVLYKLFPKEDEKPDIILGDDAVRLIESIKASQRDIIAMESVVDKEKNELKLMLKEHSAGKAGNYRVTWRNQEKKEYTVKASKTRVFRIWDTSTKGKKGE